MMSDIDKMDGIKVNMPPAAEMVNFEEMISKIVEEKLRHRLDIIRHTLKESINFNYKAFLDEDYLSNFNSARNEEEIMYCLNYNIAEPTIEEKVKVHTEFELLRKMARKKMDEKISK